MNKASENLFNTALVQPLYYLLSVCSYPQFFAKVLPCTESVMFFYNDSLATSKLVTSYSIGKFN